MGANFDLVVSRVIVKVDLRGKISSLRLEIRYVAVMILIWPVYLCKSVEERFGQILPFPTFSWGVLSSKDPSAVGRYQKCPAKS